MRGSSESRLLLLAVALGLGGAGVWGCGGDETAPGPSASAARSATGARPARPEGAPSRLEVDWVAARAAPRADVSALSAGSRRALEVAELPALLPADRALLSRTIVTAGPVWYGASVPLDGATLYLHGSVVAHPAPPDAQPRPAGEVTLSREAGIVAVSFDAYGVAYSLHVECASPLVDERCAGDDFALSLVDGLAVAGGLP